METTLIEWALATGALALVPACIAKLKGYTFFGWWFFGFLLWFVATPLAIVMRPDRQALDQEAINYRGMRRCPQCSELIRRQAQVCRYCASASPPVLSASEAEARDRDQATIRS